MDNVVEMESTEFHDWEVLPDISSVVQNSIDLEGIERDSEDIIRPDYFSLDSHPKYVVTSEGMGDLTDDGSIESDNPSWIDPGSENRYSMKEFWPDLNSDRSSDDGKYGGDFEGKSELGMVESGKTHVGFDAIEIESDSSVVSEKFDNFMEKSEISMDDDELTEDKLVDVPEEGREERENENVAIEAMKTGSEEGNGNSLRGAVWWKLPLDLLRYCVFRASPVWTISVAAAMMGFIILGRRLYKMKHKSRSLQLKVTVDDKKVSQFMSRAARLNEAFSVVKRVPIIRPSLPAAGVAPWPMMSLR